MQQYLHEIHGSFCSQEILPLSSNSPLTQSNNLVMMTGLPRSLFDICPRVASIESDSSECLWASEGLGGFKDGRQEKRGAKEQAEDKQAAKMHVSQRPCT